MQRQLEAFFARPTRARHRAARKAICTVSPVPPSAEDFSRLDQLLKNKAYEQARLLIDQLPPLAALSPRVHAIAAETARQLGDEEDAALEHFLEAACLEGLLASGNGTKSQPYVVCCRMDEFDVLSALGESPQAQRVVRAGDRICDVILCENGRKVWFDASLLVPLSAVQFAGVVAAGRRRAAALFSQRFSRIRR
jgi:hypothetical protein